MGSRGHSGTGCWKGREGEFDPGLRAPLASLPVGLQGPASGRSWPCGSRKWGAGLDPAQAAAGSPGLGAAGGADGAERSDGRRSRRRGLVKGCKVSVALDE